MSAAPSEPWWKVGACIGMDPGLFIHPSKAEKAKAVCAECPLSIKLACLDDAIATGADGVRGGLTEKDRRRASTVAVAQVELRRKPEPKSEHGTEARAKRHRRDGEIPSIVCPDCAEAETQAAHARKERRRIARRQAQRATVAPVEQRA